MFLRAEIGGEDFLHGGRGLGLSVEQHRLSYFPRKELLDAGSQLSAPPRHVVVDSGGRLCSKLLGRRSGNMVELYGTVV